MRPANTLSTRREFLHASAAAAVSAAVPASNALAQHARQQPMRSEEHTSELQSLTNLVCRLLLEKKKKKKKNTISKPQQKRQKKHNKRRETQRLHDTSS